MRLVRFIVVFVAFLLLSVAMLSQGTTEPPVVLTFPIPTGCTAAITGNVVTFTCPYPTITPPPPTFAITTPVTLPAGTAGVAYSTSLAAPVKPTGGVPPYTFAAGATFPTWLTLTASGLLTGTPPAAGTFTLNFTVTDSSKSSTTNGGPSASPASNTVAFTVR